MTTSLNFKIIFYTTIFILKESLLHLIEEANVFDLNLVKNNEIIFENINEVRFI